MMEFHLATKKNKITFRKMDPSEKSSIKRGDSSLEQEKNACSPSYADLAYNVIMHTHSERERDREI